MNKILFVTSLKVHQKNVSEVSTDYQNTCIKGPTMASVVNRNILAIIAYCFRLVSIVCVYTPMKHVNPTEGVFNSEIQVFIRPCNYSKHLI